MCKVEFVLKSYPNINSPARPVIDIAFKNPGDKNKKFPVIGLVDSGADNCTIPLKAAQTLGLDLKELNAKKIEMGCACGNKKFFGYQYKILAEFKRNPTPPVTDWRIARSLRSLSRISKNANILDTNGAFKPPVRRLDGIFAFKTIEGKAMDKLIWVDFADSDTLPLIGRSFMEIFKQIAYNNEEKKGYFIGLKEED